MPVDDAKRLRVIRAMTGMSASALARELGTIAETLRSWERGRSIPRGKHRTNIAKFCQKHKIAFLPSGMPVPFTDCLLFKEEDKNA